MSDTALASPVIASSIHHAAPIASADRLLSAADLPTYSELQKQLKAATASSRAHKAVLAMDRLAREAGLPTYSDVRQRMIDADTYLRDIRSENFKEKEENIVALLDSNPDLFCAWYTLLDA